MARGWESKSVESQIEDRQASAAAKVEQREPDEMERARKRESIELSRRRVLNDLETAQSPVHRTALENALKFLDEELARFR
jgi:hypothetical protein